MTFLGTGFLLCGGAAFVTGAGGVGWTGKAGRRFFRRIGTRQAMFTLAWRVRQTFRRAVKKSAGVYIRCRVSLSYSALRRQWWLSD